MDKDDEKKIKIRAYLDVFGSDNGRIVLKHLKILTKFNWAFVPNTTGNIDPLEVMRQEGMRSVIIHIEMMLKKDPDEKKGITNEPRE